MNFLVYHGVAYNEFSEKYNDFENYIDIHIKSGKCIIFENHFIFK